MKRMFICTITGVSMFFIFSCNKVNDLPPTPQQVDSVKIFGVDSTELVKSVTDIQLDSLGNVSDSITTYYYYDTLHLRIFSDSVVNTDPNPANHAEVLSYNTSYQLIKEETNPGVYPGITSSAEYFYDNDHILSQEIDAYNNGNGMSYDTTTYVRTNLPAGGYGLTYTSWYGIDTTVETYSFDAMGKLSSYSFNITSVSSNDWYLDTVEYDASGNMNSLIETSKTHPSPRTLVNVNGRTTKGNEFYMLYKTLYNGTSQFTFEGGIYGFDNYLLCQITQYPGTSVIVYDEGLDSDVTFNPNAQFDSKGRLSSMKIYWGDAGDKDYYDTIKLGYYK